MQNQSPKVSAAARNALTLGALGVVFGDIGTSPLYTIRECLRALPPGEHAQAILGVLSLIFWSLLLVVSLKYTLFVLRADNRGEGGVFALLALSQLDRPGKTVLNLGVIVVLTGAAMLCGDRALGDRGHQGGLARRGALYRADRYRYFSGLVCFSISGDKIYRANFWACHVALVCSFGRLGSLARY